MSQMSSSLLWSRWDEIDRLLSAALERPGPLREAWIRREVAEDGAFLELVLRLVARLETEQDRLSGPSESVVSGAFGPDESRGAETELAPGARIGRYEIVARRGRGGMATVYEAERVDGVYRQRVALKVLRRGLDTDDLIQRFLTERQILSSLNHPNIARLLDGGSSPDGRPYLVMELVDGQPITRHADQRQLDVPARLRLFLGVADAVHAAHRRLVVHRDIKPTNILVDDEGRVKLLDFGIAKLLDERRESTEVGALALTPDYASPEQLRGDSISTATDVYQLGLLLRELLTGVRPLRTDPVPGELPIRASRLAERSLERADSPEARAAARGTSPPRLARTLRGDLDLILAKALRPEPEERYPSADELAADVRRHLRGLPVLAHHESVRYRARKFIARHAWAVASGVAALLVLTGYAVTVTVQSRRIVLERDRAELEARKAGQVTEFLVDLFHAADPNVAGGRQITARELLEQGARELDAAAVEDPDVRAAMLAAIGRSYRQLGLYREAEAHLARAVEARRASEAPDGIALGRDLNILATLVGQHDRRRSLALHEEALAVVERHGGSNHPMAGVILANYAVALSHARPQDSAPSGMIDRAVGILREGGGGYRKELAHALLASAYGKPPADALPRMREALGLLRDLHGERHTAVADALSDLALATERVDPLAADSLMQRALEIKLSIYGPGHPRLLGTMNNLAAVRRDRGDHAGAEPLYREVLAMRTALYPEQKIPRAYTLHGLGLVLVGTGRAAEGESKLREALAILEAELPANHPLIPLTRAAVGHAMSRQGRYADAERLLTTAAQRVLDGPVAPQTKMRTLGWVVSLYEAWGQRAAATSYRQRLDSLSRESRLSGGDGS